MTTTTTKPDAGGRPAVTDASTTLLVAIALLTTHAKQPKARQVADELQQLRAEYPAPNDDSSTTEEDES